MFKRDVTRGDVAGRKVYIAGKITGLDRAEALRRFGAAEARLRGMGAIPFNPTCLPEGFSWYDYMGICLQAVRVCDAIYLLGNWEGSDGAKQERRWAKRLNLLIFYEPKSQSEK